MDSEAWLCLMLRRLLLSVLLLVLHKGADGLKIVKLNVPTYALAGQSVTLECIYEMEGDDLYSVKWYKDTHEFFRYIPQDQPPKQIFSLPGIKVDQDKSSDKYVHLVDIELNSTGSYKCEVSAEAPNFDTESQKKEMNVYDVPDDGAQIQGLKNKYNVGDIVNVNCTARRSKPAAQLQWHINGDTATSDMLKKYETIVDSNDLETSILGLTFKVDPQHLIHSELRLNCTASLGYIYQDVAFFNMFFENRVSATVLENKATPSQVKSGTNDTATLRSLVWSILIAAALLLR